MEAFALLVSNLSVPPITWPGEEPSWDRTNMRAYKMHAEWLALWLSGVPAKPLDAPSVQICSILVTCALTLGDTRFGNRTHKMHGCGATL